MATEIRFCSRAAALAFYAKRGIGVREASFVQGKTLVIDYGALEWESFSVMRFEAQASAFDEGYRACLNVQGRRQAQQGCLQCGGYKGEDGSSSSSRCFCQR
jgi:hypothetical protein